MADCEPIRALGLMSGTSMDGVDGAILVTDGADSLSFGETFFRPYDVAERAVLRSVQGLWAEAGPALEDARDILHRAHQAVMEALGPADVAGFHGQTLAHDPDGGRTHQLGDGAALAAAVGVDVVWDFRSADMAAGGVGAPLAPFYHFACARHIGAGAPVGFLNLGGVANVTLVDPSAPAPDAPGAVRAFDCGPGNALVDDFVAARTGRAWDDDGALAAAGAVDMDIVGSALSHPFFAAAGPKALDRNDFSDLVAAVSGLSDADGAATLCEVTVAGVARAAAAAPPDRWLVCGGGRKNRHLMARLGAALAAPVDPVEAVGLDGDFLEAQAFAWLAVRRLRGLPGSAPETTGCRAPVVGGRVSRAGERGA